MNIRALSAVLGLAMSTALVSPAFAGQAGVNNTYTNTWSTYQTHSTGSATNYYTGVSDALSTSYKEGLDGSNAVVKTLTDKTAFSGSFDAPNYKLDGEVVVDKSGFLPGLLPPGFGAGYNTGLDVTGTLKPTSDGSFEGTKTTKHDVLLSVYHIIDTSTNHEVVYFGGSDTSAFDTYTQGGSNSSGHQSSAFTNF